jgi:hypothetical protein
MALPRTTGAWSDRGACVGHACPLSVFVLGIHCQGLGAFDLLLLVSGLLLGHVQYRRVGWGIALSPH